jgi:hypothetical protein
MASTAVGVHGVAPQQSGSAAGLLAAIAAIVTRSHPQGHTAATAMTDGYVAGLLGGAAIFVIGAVIALLTVNIRVSAEELPGH